MTVGCSRGGEAAVNLLDTVGHALNGFSIGDVLLDDLEPRLFIVHKGNFACLTGAQCHGLLRIGYDVRLGNGFLTHDIDTGRNGRERRRAICSGSNRGRITSGNGLNGKHRAGNGLTAHGIALDDLHIGQCIVLSRHSILLIAVSGIDIDADGRGNCAEALRGLRFDEGPQTLGGALDLDDTAITSHIAANDLTVVVDIKPCAIQAGSRAGRNFFQRNICIADRGSGIISTSGLILSDQFAGTIIIEE